MKNLLYTLALLLSSVSAGAQGMPDTLHFDQLALPEVGYLHDGRGLPFSFGCISLPNEFENISGFEAWNGWAISRLGDTDTRGFVNQYSSIAGTGSRDSKNFALSFGENNYIALSPDSIPTLLGCHITNSTYAYWSMLEGDAFSKRFGGTSGTDPDFFKLTIRASLGGQLRVDSVEFYLADFRSPSPEDDYIVSEWTYLDLSNLGNADTLWLTLSSSDQGIFGINTPLYFCLDDLVYAKPISTSTQSAPKENQSLIVHPNPCRNQVSVYSTKTLSPSSRYMVSHMPSGILCMAGQLNDSSIPLSTLEPGVYVLEIITNGLIYRKKIVKL